MSDESVVRNVERRIGADLPSGYRDFLLKTYGGSPENPYGSEPADIGMVVTGFFAGGRER